LIKAAVVDRPSTTTARNTWKCPLSYVCFLIATTSGARPAGELYSLVDCILVMGQRSWRDLWGVRDGSSVQVRCQLLFIGNSVIELWDLEQVVRWSFRRNLAVTI
jgi:hypothetical protein